LDSLLSLELKKLPLEPLSLLELVFTGENGLNPSADLLEDDSKAHELVLSLAL
jgi:hypothetical protein